MVGLAFKGERRLPEVGLLLPFTVAVRLVAKSSTVVTIHPHLAVAMEGVHRAARCVYRDQVMVNAQPVSLGITVGKEPSL